MRCPFANICHDCARSTCWPSSSDVCTRYSRGESFRGLLRNALRISLETITGEAGTGTERDGWKLFLLAPRMFLFRAPGVSHVPPAECKRRERLFCDGRWTLLLREIAAAAQQARSGRHSERAPAAGFEGGRLHGTRTSCLADVKKACIKKKHPAPPSLRSRAPWRDSS